MPTRFVLRTILGMTVVLLAGGSAFAGEQQQQAPRRAEKEPSGFHQIFQAGTQDEKGNVLGGTIIAALVPHAGKLFAVNGFPWDQPGDEPPPGAQILVLDRPGGTWRLDYELKKKDEWRASLDSVTFTTDGHGKKLKKPVSILLAGPSDSAGAVIVFGRDDATDTWTAMPLVQTTGTTSIRSISMYHDRVTGVDRVFAGTRPTGIFSGVYDPSVPGRIRWDKAPELTGYDYRPMNFTKCNGALYVTVKPDLYRRIDGAHPRWEKVYTIPEDIPKEGSGLRGMTTIDNPQGRGEVLLAALEGRPAQIIRINPQDGYKQVVELDLIDFLSREWGKRPSWVIPAYNDMVSATDPKTGKKVLLIGLSATFAPPSDTLPKEGWEPGGWYLIRRDEKHYELRQIVDPALSPERKLIGTRTIALSPFGDGAIYFGGYDPTRNPSHNTGWVFSAPLATALGPRLQPAPAPAAPAGGTGD
jgi:hypothetical protein